MKLRIILAGLLALCLSPVLAAVEEKPEPLITEQNKGCVDCHRKLSPALVMEWERSKHAVIGTGCVDCHKAKEGELGAWKHEGAIISALVTPKQCAECHKTEYEQFSRSHHARAGEILASLDNILAEKAAGMPGNIADAVYGCWQCPVTPATRGIRLRRSCRARRKTAGSVTWDRITRRSRSTTRANTASRSTPTATRWR